MTDYGRDPSGSGSHPSGHASCAVDGASRFDPSRKATVEIVARVQELLRDVHAYLTGEVVGVGTKHSLLCEIDDAIADLEAARGEA